jgi:hypothetical protein
VSPSLSVVIVSYESAASIAATLQAVEAQSIPGDELIVVDNASSDGTADAAVHAAPGATVIRSTHNEGFASGCNRGAQDAHGDLLLFLNQDALAASGFREAIARPWAEQPGWPAWMGLVTSGDGKRINSAGNRVHFTGVSWAGQEGEPIAAAPAAPREVVSLSGACLAVRREAWVRLGGFPPESFMYFEDTDLSLRLRLEGGRVGIEPRARVDHDYEFAKGALKWRLLERNRWATLLRTYPGPLLALVAPALLATEIALFFISIVAGWGGQKLLANFDVLRSLPRLARERSQIQSRRQIGAREFAGALTADLDSPHLGRAARSRLLRLGMRLYWRIALALLPGR